MTDTTERKKLFLKGQATNNQHKVRILIIHIGDNDKILEMVDFTMAQERLNESYYTFIVKRIKQVSSVNQKILEWAPVIPKIGE